jgi:hypothetical protein
MATIGRISRQTSAVVAAGVVLLACGAGPAHAAGSFGATVSSVTGLADGHVVTVAVHDAGANDTVAVAQCTAAREACGDVQFLRADASGAASASLAIAAHLGGTDCRPVPGTCVVIAFSFGLGSMVAVPLAFANPITVHVDDNGTIDPRTKALIVTGSVDCFGLHGRATVVARQEKPHVREVTGAAVCSGEYGTHSWSVTIPNRGKSFVPGHVVHFDVSVALDTDPSAPVATDAADGSVSNAASGRL